ncbi:glycosyltransferase family 9 protein, partial [Salmonella enterica subsp. enterica serovar 4:-:1,2]|nr:glycosyltransferase family 9 protein [Salmonella enterica subsp. enterica serovar 4:-:1,2]
DKEALSCQPCQSTICKVNDHRCMRNIAASEVVAIAEKVLAEGGTGT